MRFYNSFTQDIATRASLQARLPNTSLPRARKFLLDGAAWYPLVDAPRPVYDQWTQKLVPAHITLDDEKATQSWEIEPLEASEQARKRQAHYTSVIQSALDAFARTRGYDNIMSACSYAASTDAAFAAEAAYCVTLRDTTWRQGYVILAEVQAGTRPVPTEAELLAMLSVGSAAWPEGGAGG